MISVSIPGWGELNIEYLLVDYNGTCAFEGKLKSEVKQILERISRYVKIFIITSDSYGNIEEEERTIGFSIIKVAKEESAKEKAKIVKELGPEKVVAIGNGSNDALMLKEAALGIGVIGEEGASTAILKEADLLVKDIVDALNIILHPERMIATLRE